MSRSTESGNAIKCNKLSGFIYWFITHFNKIINDKIIFTHLPYDCAQKLAE